MCNRNVFSRVREEGGERRKEEGGGEGCMRMRDKNGGEMRSSPPSYAHKRA